MLRGSVLAITVLGLIGAPPVLAKKQRPSYDAFRAELIRKGYRPLKLTHGDRYFCFDGFCDAYPEAVSCTAAGLPRCGMGFIKPGGHGYIIVDTLGERVHSVQVIRKRAPGPYELCSMKEGHDDYQDCDQVPEIERK